MTIFSEFVLCVKDLVADALLGKLTYVQIEGYNLRILVTAIYYSRKIDIKIKIVCI